MNVVWTLLWDIGWFVALWVLVEYVMYGPDDTTDSGPK
jgi:hypothetical protein